MMNLMEGGTDFSERDALPRPAALPAAWPAHLRKTLLWINNNIRFPVARPPAAAWPALCTLCTLLFSAPGEASVCESPGGAAYVSAGVVHHRTSRLAQGPGETEQKNRELQVFVTGPWDIDFGFHHRYTTFDFEGIDPQTNAHVHTSSFPVHWSRGNLRVSVAPTLAASSNVLGHPQKYGSDTFRVDLGLLWERQFSKRLDVRYGLCGDDRFGEYRLYPSAGVEWRPHPDWTLELGFPASAVTFRIGDSLSTEFRLEPDGSEWHVMDRDFDAESSFMYESWTADWKLAFEAGEHLVVAAGFGRQFRNRFEMTLQSGERIGIDGEAANRVGAEVRWRF